MAEVNERHAGIEHRHIDVLSATFALPSKVAPPGSPKAAVWPVSVSTTGKPTFAGASPAAPPSLIMPVVACTMLSIAGQSRREPFWPYPEMEQ